MCINAQMAYYNHEATCLRCHEGLYFLCYCDILLYTMLSLILVINFDVGNAYDVVTYCDKIS